MATGCTFTQAAVVVPVDVVPVESDMRARQSRLGPVSSKGVIPSPLMPNINVCRDSFPALIIVLI